MTTFFRKYSTLISFLLVLVIFTIIWMFPPLGTKLLIIFLVFGLVVNSFMIVKKHRAVYLQGRISRITFIRNICLELTGILLVMLLAGLLGNHIARITTSTIDHSLTKFIVGVLVGLLVGIAVGIFIKRTWNGFLQVFKWVTSSQANKIN